MILPKKDKHGLHRLSQIALCEKFEIKNHEFTNLLTVL